MASVRAAISLPEDLHKEVDVLAKRMGMPRSQLYVSALREFLKHQNEALLLEQINSALDQDEQEDELAIASRMRKLLK